MRSATVTMGWRDALLFLLAVGSSHTAVDRYQPRLGTTRVRGGGGLLELRGGDITGRPHSRVSLDARLSLLLPDASGEDLAKLKMTSTEAHVDALALKLANQCDRKHLRAVRACLNAATAIFTTLAIFATLAVALPSASLAIFSAAYFSIARLCQYAPDIHLLTPTSGGHTVHTRDAEHVSPSETLCEQKISGFGWSYCIGGGCIFYIYSARLELIRPILSFYVTFSSFKDGSTVCNW